MNSHHTISNAIWSDFVDFITRNNFDLTKLLVIGLEEDQFRCSEHLKILLSKHDSSRTLRLIEFTSPESRSAAKYYHETEDVILYANLFSIHDNRGQIEYRLVTEHYYRTNIKLPDELVSFTSDVTLPPTLMQTIQKFDVKRPFLILDMDETLLHARKCQSELASSTMIQHSLNDRQERYSIQARPGLQHFLATASDLFNVVVLSMGIRHYVDACIATIDRQESYFCAVLSRDDGTDISGLGLIKQLENLGIPLVFVDDKIEVAITNINNVIPISKFTGSSIDTALYEIIAPLTVLAQVTQDFRKVIPSYCPAIERQVKEYNSYMEEKERERRKRSNSHVTKTT
jgi:hypothetical protein